MVPLLYDQISADMGLPALDLFPFSFIVFGRSPTTVAVPASDGLLKVGNTTLSFSLFFRNSSDGSNSISPDWSWE